MALTKKLVEDFKRKSVLKFYRAGMSVMKIAQVMGWTQNKITRILRRANVEEVERRGTDSKRKV